MYTEYQGSWYLLEVFRRVWKICIVHVLYKRANRRKNHFDVVISENTGSPPITNVPLYPS